MERKIFDNKSVFLLYGWINILLVAFLLTLLALIFNQVYILSRFQFVIFVGIHLSLIFFVKVHYLSIFYDRSKEKLEFNYNRKFGLNWMKKSRTTLLPLKQLQGYTLSKDSLGLPVISFFKIEKGIKYELGPFHVGRISGSQLKKLQDSLGAPIKN